MRRFEFSDAGSDKFWEVDQDGCDVTVRYGKIGTAGQTQTKSHADEAAADAALEKLVKEKTGKGYREIGAAAPVAAAPTAPRPALVVQPAPLAEPAAVPAPVPAGDTAPWLANGAVIDMPAKLRAMVMPSRRKPGPPRNDNAAQCWDGFIKHAGNYSQPAAQESHKREALARIEGNLLDGSLESDAVLMAMEASQPVNLAQSDGAPFVDFLVAHKGLPYAVQVLLHLEMYLDRGGPVTRTSRPFAEIIKRDVTYCVTELALRAHLAHADQATWDQCATMLADAAGQLCPSRRPLLGILLPDLPELSNRLALDLGGPNADSSAIWLLLTATSEEARLALRHKKPDGAYWNKMLYDEDFAVANIIGQHGTDAVPALADGALTDAAARALTYIGTPAAITVLALVSDKSKPARTRYATAANRWPLAAIAALSEIIAAKPSSAAAFGDMLHDLAYAQSARLDAFAPWLSPKAAQLLQTMAAGFGAPLDIADAGDLPRILSAPPWASKRKAARAALDLQPLPLEPVERWDPAARRKALGPSHFSVEQLEANFERLEALRDNPMQMASDLTFREPPYTERAAAAITAQDAPALIKVWNDYCDARICYGANARIIAHLPEKMGAAVWNELAYSRFLSDAPYALARFGVRGIPGLISMIDKRPDQDMPHALHFGAVELAAPIARAFVKLKNTRDIARTWLLAWPEHAACALIAPALGKAGEARECASAALRLLAAEGHGEMLIAVAARYPQAAVADAMRAMLAEDPREQYPEKIGKLPDFWQPAGWSRPLLISNGKAVPDSALEAIGIMLRFPCADGVYAGIGELKKACTPDSLADFVWDAFQAWLGGAAASKEAWIVQALGLLGNDSTARKLTPYLRAWPSEGQATRALGGLDVLAMIGTDTAMMLLNGIAQKVKSKPLQDRAREKIAQIAEARALRTEELEDRIAPDLGLDEQGTLELDFGPRKFRVGFDEALRPYVRDEANVRLPDLPKPNRSDDATLSAAALERFKLLKKDARTIASQQIVRLEVAMCSRRRWEPQVFITFLAGHPLLRTLVQRIVWGAYEVEEGSGSHGGRLVSCFRVAPDGGYTDSADDAFALPLGPAIRIGIPHALEIPALDAAAFGQLLADYELVQPFTQIGRDTHALTAPEMESSDLRRWKGVAVETGYVFGLASKGWRRGEVQSRGKVWYFTKELGNGRVIELNFEPGFMPTELKEDPRQTLTTLTTGRINSEGTVEEAEPMASLDPIAASELIRDMENLRG